MELHEINEILNKVGIDLWGNENPRWTVELLVKMIGELLEKQATTTYENAKYSSELMANEGLRSAIVVTSPTHTKRSRIIFNSFFKNNSTDLTICAVPDKTASSKKWWQDDIGVQRITIECMKLIYYYLFQKKTPNKSPTKLSKNQLTLTPILIDNRVYYT